MNKRQKQLMLEVPLMKCANKAEFDFRLGCLSNGMLRNHMESVINYKIDQSEIEQYLRYKENLK